MSRRSVNCNSIFGAIRIKRKTAVDRVVFCPSIEETLKLHRGNAKSWSPSLVERRVDIVRDALQVQHQVSKACGSSVGSYRRALLLDSPDCTNREVNDKVLRRNAAQHVAFGTDFDVSTAPASSLR